MIYFVTENFLKINTPITKNVDVTDVYPYVKPASDMRLQAILGSYFYNYLLTQYNDEVLTPDEITLVEKEFSNKVVIILQAYLKEKLLSLWITMVRWQRFMRRD